MVTAELGAVGRADGVTSVQRLSDGVIAVAWLISYADGSRIASARPSPGRPVTAPANGKQQRRVTAQNTHTIHGIWGHVQLKNERSAFDPPGH